MIWSCVSENNHSEYFFQAEHLTSCYWGGSSNALDRHDPSLPYLEQYRIDFEQFKGMFVLLFPWACGTHSDVLASRLFQLLDENRDSLINFREFVSGLSKDGIFLYELGRDSGRGCNLGSLYCSQAHTLGLEEGGTHTSSFAYLSKIVFG